MGKRFAALRLNKTCRPSHWRNPQRSSGSLSRIITKKLEEDFLFPRFKKANKLVDLVDVLLQQHQAGRRLTDITMRLATNQALKNADDRRKLMDSMLQFIRLYNPHEAREDTVLFPAFHGIVSAHEFDSLGEDFEKKEDELFGDDGFFKLSIALRKSKRSSAFMIWPNSHQKHEENQSSLLSEIALVLVCFNHVAGIRD